MNSVVKVAKIYVGVDVSKATLDVYRPDTGKLSKIDSSEEAIEILFVELQKKGSSAECVGTLTPNL